VISAVLSELGWRRDTGAVVPAEERALEPWQVLARRAIAQFAAVQTFLAVVRPGAAVSGSGRRNGAVN
jgi:hypothetical protein